MAGLFDQFTNMNPEQAQGLLAAAAQMLQQSGPSRTPTSLGQVMGGGIGAYQGATAEAQRRKQEQEQAQQAAQMRAQQMQMGQFDLAQRQRGDAEEQAMQGAYREGGNDPQALIDAVSRVNPMKGMELRAKLAKQAPKFDSGIIWVNGPDGKPMAMRTADDGSIKQIDGVAPRDKMELANLGGKDLAYNPYGLTAGQTFQRTQSPDSLASNAIAIRGQNMADARSRATSAEGGKAPTGYRWTASGSLEPIPGGPAGHKSTSSEGERKAATLLQRLQFSENQLEQAVTQNPSAAKPNMLANGLRSAGLESAANSLTGSERQRVDAAQLDILDAALTLGTGAAYTREQLEGYRKSYFPQIGDSASNVADKQARLKNVINAAKTQAGRSAPSPQATPTPEPGVRKYNPKTGKIE